MDTKDNLYVNAADICLSMGYDRTERDYVEIRAVVDHPVRAIDLDEYTKKVQDDMMEALKEVHRMDIFDARRIILGEDRTSIIRTIEESSGHELMERYEKWKSDEENKLLRERIEAAKKLLREHGFEVVKEV